MRPSLLALVLIVNLLTCPLRCMSCESHASISVESECASCDCCSLSDNVPGSNDSDPQNQDCGCSCCVCEGAVVSSPVELPEVIAVVCWLLPLQLNLSVQDGLLVFVEANSSGPFGHTFSGRGARIAHQSWQI